MKLLSSLVAIVLAVAVVEASNVHEERSHSARHAHIARRGSSSSKRCKVKSSSSFPHTTSTTNNPPTSTYVAPTTSVAAAPASTPVANYVDDSKSSVKGAIAGLISVKSKCGDIGATKDITAVSGPNGNIDWLNCGLNDGGWRPPFVHISDLIAADLSTAIKDKSSPFKACSEYIGLFEKYGGEFNVPPIMLASFAMQESSCNPATVGGAGEQGLMQITKDKCGSAPGGNCKDPDYNIRTGAQFFSDTLNSNGGDVLKTIGQYNGWSPQLTFGQATAAASTSCCRCQNNLDYLHQFVNGWLQNVDAYTMRPRLGKYFNLDQCD
ncbi:glycoside hydrolase family 23 protein [Heterobasidion irregulare TC 32-1]|uniref:Glycoside hydrolase family 23 protein n=1 Tax=Heterobasidion irregulare (strain TC 32-1) TaxID=747525 RepID=W4K411_HETIT|nr:glycoside hydrolase family 23 protein [Heterobasidion irregulare TC 32-1]ETW80578.1 glycoside hydrolase family 23 protein [Heterobasidion irregulare TC 32-1]